MTACSLNYLINEQEETITSSLRTQAMRLALYLRSIGIEPNITGQSYREYLANLERQFQQLSPDQRREAKRRGRKTLKELGFDIATENLIAIPPNREEHERFRRKRLEQMIHWPDETPPCPKCRFKRFNLSKKSWKSREAAEQELAKHKKTLLAVYPCPAQEGFWHLGHPKKQKNSTNTSIEKESFTNSNGK